MTVEYTTELAGFKSNGVNFKVTLWDPKYNGSRYLKTLTFCLAARLGPADRERLRRIRNRDVGDPITVRYDGEDICMDYLRAVLEVGFIADVLDLNGKRVVEIGAGYGRTCHAIMSNYDVAEYHIVDRHDMLRLSRQYLRAVLDDDQFARLSFHSVAVAESSKDYTYPPSNLADVRNIFPHDVDLCMNIDSFAGMDEDTVRGYLSLIGERCRNFYVNGSVGKYLDKSLDNHSQGAEPVASALNSGLLREVLDIYDNKAVKKHSAEFCAVYQPGPDWELVADAATSVWCHFWQALYRRVR